MQFAVALFPQASVTLYANEKLPVTRGVPEICPVEESKAKPVGNAEGDKTDQE